MRMVCLNHRNELDRSTLDLNTDQYCDVYDGRVWREFLTYDGQPFLSVPFNFAFQLNINWFQPFEHTQHSEGVMYLTVMNLPRSERFLQENVILVGVLPGPKEPQLNVNSFLEPLVKDLLDLWKGVILHTKEGTPVLVRAALLCVGCDIPAARKTCGFVGHGALRGCSKCLLPFPTEHFGDKPDYSNFNRSEWTSRSLSEHRSSAAKHKVGSTKAALNTIERETGVRYTILLELPYFDPVRMCIIDPMHNLFLGTAKKMIELWKECDFLPSSVLHEIQEKVNFSVSPGEFGMFTSKDRIRIFRIYSRTMEELDTLLFFVLFKRCATTCTLRMLAPICKGMLSSVSSHYI